MLIENDHGHMLQRTDAKGCIRFDTLQPEFHQSRFDFPYGTWNIAALDFTPALDTSLPTPVMPELPPRLEVTPYRAAQM